MAHGLHQSTKIAHPESQETVSGKDSEPGDLLAILSGGFVGHAVLLVSGNGPGLCFWSKLEILTQAQENDHGVFSYAYVGRRLGLDAMRTFRFTHLKDSAATTGSKTLFTHFASWEGYAAIMFMAWSPVRAHVRGLFKGFHDDMKNAVEKSSK
jgi:hypothetical protein